MGRTRRRGRGRGLTNERALPVEQIYAAMLTSLGFEECRIPSIEEEELKRKSLFEFDVSAR